MEALQQLTVDQIDLSDLEFWALPPAVRDGAFKTLREQRPIPFFPEPDLEIDWIPQGPGYYALTRHADVVEASRHPDLFQSGSGAVSIPDMPVVFLEFFGSMINIDDPRHARLRGIVSAGFTPKMLRKLEGDVRRAAARIVDDVQAKGSCDFVTEVASRLPLRVICDMMGIPEQHESAVASHSSIILSQGDPEFIPEGTDVVAALLGAGQALAELVQDLGEFRKRQPTDDLTSALVNANVDGEHLNDQELASFFILLVVAGNETTRNAISHGLKVLTDNPEQRRLCWRTSMGGRRLRSKRSCDGPHRSSGCVEPRHVTPCSAASSSTKATRFCCSTTRPTATKPPLSNRTASMSGAIRIPTSASVDPALISAWEPTWPGGRSR